jgi:hypothetical protein
MLIAANTTNEKQVMRMKGKYVWWSDGWTNLCLKCHDKSIEGTGSRFFVHEKISRD